MMRILKISIFRYISHYCKRGNALKIQQLTNAEYFDGKLKNNTLPLNFKDKCHNIWYTIIKKKLLSMFFHRKM